MVEATGAPQEAGCDGLGGSSPDQPVKLRSAIPAAPAATRPPARHARPGVASRLVRVLRPMPYRAWVAVVEWSRGPTARFLLPGAFCTVLIGIAVAIGAFVVPADGGDHERVGLSRPATGTSGPAVADPSTHPPTVGPSRAAVVPQADEADGLPADVLRAWAQQMSIRTGVPVVALQAYGYTELVLAETTPACRLSWTTLAAIGRVESDHGRAGGSSLRPDGRSEPPIVGEPLDGQDGRMLIRDTDNGRLDGDPVYDRAVGPMQFIPQTWRTEAVDATGDGDADINNIHDAALAAGNYLCRGRRDLSTASDWWQAILSYNNVQSYADQIFSAAQEYGRQSRT